MIAQTTWKYNILRSKYPVVLLYKEKGNRELQLNIDTKLVE